MKFINNLKDSYSIIFEFSLIVALLLVLSAFKIPTPDNEPLTIPEEKFETISLEDIPVTKPDKKPAVPPKPSVFTEVPNHEVIEAPIDEMKIDWENSGNLMLPEEADEEELEEKIFRVVEQEPQIKGGIKSLYEDLTYPRRAVLANIEGTVQVQFVVGKDGSVSNAKVVRGIGGGCDREALRAVKNLTFEPGRQRGQAVKVELKIPVRFKLQ